MDIIHTDVLIIGGGLAGLRVGIGARRRGHNVLILSLVPPKRSHSAAAQGGMQASLANAIKGEGDNEDVHFADTVRGSDWGADQAVVRMFVNTAPKAVRELAAWGVPWNRVRRGPRKAVIKDNFINSPRVGVILNYYEGTVATGGLFTGNHVVAREFFRIGFTAVSPFKKVSGNSFIAPDQQCPVILDTDDYGERPIVMKGNFWGAFRDPSTGEPLLDNCDAGDELNTGVAVTNGSLGFPNSVARPFPIRYKGGL